MYKLGKVMFKYILIMFIGLSVSGCDLQKYGKPTIDVISKVSFKN
jgi:hypothetical protein